MKKPTAISRRMFSFWENFADKNYEKALIDLFPALDKTSHLRQPKALVGERIKRFISDEERLISAMACGVVIEGARISGLTFSEAIYKFGRTAIVHEGELDPRIEFNNDGKLEIGEKWNLPTTYVSALGIVTMLAPENVNEYCETNATFTLSNKIYQFNSLWGARALIEPIFLGDFPYE